MLHTVQKRVEFWERRMETEIDRLYVLWKLSGDEILLVECSKPWTVVCYCLCFTELKMLTGETNVFCQRREGTHCQGYPKNSNYVSIRLSNQIHFGSRICELLFVIPLFLICYDRHELNRTLQSYWSGVEFDFIFVTERNIIIFILRTTLTNSLSDADVPPVSYAT